MKKLTKSAVFTDIHWGCKSNSEQHNQDCLDFIDWFCVNVKKDKTIDNIIFLGDWFENRSALNISTLNYSYQGAKKINDLGLPVFFIIGNHDLYHRHTREIFSPINFHEFSNFTLINEPIKIENLGEGNLICPYLFPEEYPLLVKYEKLPVWWGHFEFKGFVVTGYNIVMPTGPDASDFKKQRRIFSGHFHKRQINGNVCYIGNCFPTNYSDADDNDRGMMIYDHIKDKPTFINWTDCPKYTKIKLSNLIDTSITLPEGARVKCIIDVPISFEESTILRQSFIDTYGLREFYMEETQQLTQALENTETVVEIPTDKLDSIDDLVIKMLTEINTEHIDNNLLIEQYKKL